MALAAGCPRCPTPVSQVDLSGEAAVWACPDHGEVTPLWRPDRASYDHFVDHLELSDGLPTYLPWPLSPGWRVTDFGAIEGRASYACASGTSELDGPVDVLLVVEEPGVGLGARWAGTRHDDPGADVLQGQPTARLWVEGQAVSLWPISTSDGPSKEWDRSVVVGEAGGRWLWVVLRPASAMLLLREGWRLRDVSSLGPALVEVPFGGPDPGW